MLLIRKIFGKTKIILPIDVEISVSASSIYGRVQFLDLSFWDLRNESISIASPGYRDSHKRVKVVVNSLFGDVGGNPRMIKRRTYFLLVWLSALIVLVRCCR